MLSKENKKSMHSDDEDWRVQSANLKSEGDAAFAKGEYMVAVEKYGSAISIDDDNHILYSNRCACLLKLSEKSRALRDGEKCVELKPDWGKGYGRLASAQHALTRYDAAMETYRKGLRVEPESKALKDGLEAARKAKEGAERALEEKKKEEAKKKQEEEAQQENLLGDFFGDIAATVEESNEKNVPKKDVEPQKKYLEQDLGSSAENIERLLQVNYMWKNLNPYNVLLLDIDANVEDVKSRYKKLSTLVHPDKNMGNDQAKDAFDEVKKAYNTLKDTEQREYVVSLVKAGRSRADEVFKKSKDAGALEEVQKKEVMKVFAEIEANRRASEQRKLNMKKRERDQEDEEQERRKKEYKFNKEW